MGPFGVMLVLLADGAPPDGSGPTETVPRNESRLEPPGRSCSGAARALSQGPSIAEAPRERPTEGFGDGELSLRRAATQPSSA